MTGPEKEYLWRVISTLKPMYYPGATYLAYDTPRDPRVRGGRYTWTFNELQIIYKYLVFYAEQDRGAAAWLFLLGYKTKIRPWKLHQIYNALKFSPSVSYTITPNDLSISEDETVIFDVYTTGVPDGTTLYWTLLSGPPNPIVGSDFTDGLSSGSFTITGNVGSISRTLIEDFTYDTPESFQIEVRTGSVVGPVVATSDPVEVISLVNPLRLIYTDLSLVNGITNPSSVSQWNALLNLPLDGDVFTSVQVVGTTEVRLRGSTAGTIAIVTTTAFTDPALVSVYDYGAFIWYLGYRNVLNSGFHPGSVLYLPGVTDIDSESITSTGFTQIRIPNCIVMNVDSIISNSSVDVLDISSHLDDPTNYIYLNTYTSNAIIYMNDAMMNGSGGEPYINAFTNSFFSFDPIFYYTPTTQYFVGIWDGSGSQPTYISQGQSNILVFIRTGTPPVIDVGSQFHWEIVPISGTLTPSMFGLSSFSNSFTQAGSFAFISFQSISAAGGETFRIDYKNSLGAVLDSTPVYEIIAPPFLITTGSSSITSTSVTLSADLTSEGGGTVTSRGIRYGLTNNLAVGTDVLAAGVGTGPYSVSITGLTPNTTYYYRAYAVNEAGAGASPFPLASFTTSSAATAQGPLYPGTGVNDSSIGSSPFTFSGSPLYAYTFYSSNETYYAKFTNFGFSIPLGATIIGIVATVTKSDTGGAMNVYDNAVRIVKNGVIGTTDKSNPTMWSNVGPVISTYGTSSDLWGQTWTPADINNSNFGLAFSVKYLGFSKSGVPVELSQIKLTVHYIL